MLARPSIACSVRTLSRAFWRGLLNAAARTGATVHGTPPEVGVDVSADFRLYASEVAPTEPLPAEVTERGAALRQVVIDRHNRRATEAFLAEVLASVTGWVDADDDGSVVPAAAFVAAVRDGQRA